MNTKKLIMTGFLAGAVLAPLTWSQPAEAREYCREFQKTIRVGGHLESGYGTACMQPDGAWMITDTRGNVDPFDDLRAQNVMLVTRERPVYYHYGPQFRPVTYYAHRPHYRNRGTTFFFNFGDDDDRRWRNHRHRDRHDHDRGRGRGHGHHRGRH